MAAYVCVRASTDQVHTLPEVRSHPSLPAATDTASSTSACTQRELRRACSGLDSPLHTGTRAPMPNTRPGTLACDYDLIMRRYASLAPLTPTEHALLRSVSDNAEFARTGEEIETEDLPRMRPRLLVSGWACRFHLIADGRRMIVGLLLPGDSIGFGQRQHPTALTSIGALCPCRLLDATRLWTALAQDDGAHRSLAHAQRTLETIEDVHTLAHIVRLGRLNALERICHLFLELHDRLQTVGLVWRDSFIMPLTYDSLADTVGLSVVHVNRTLQTMRRRRLIELRQGRVTLLDPHAMAAECDFHPPLAPAHKPQQRHLAAPLG